MKKTRTRFWPATALLAALAVLPAAPAAANEIQALSGCLADSTTGKDRKDLARWVFLSMAAHPEIQPFVSPAAAGPAGGEVNKTVAALFTRLLTNSCATQTRAAFLQGGPVAIQAAFETLGQLAMQELMSNPAVAASMSGFEKLLDEDKLKAVLSKP